MLARLLLALLAFALATPAAAAACHTQPARGHHAGAANHGSIPADRDEAAPAGACIGCVPPSNWIAPPAAEPILAPAAAPSARVAALSLGRETPPALPPPRIG